MKIILLIALCYLLCYLLKSVWKAFFIGLPAFILISFFVQIVSVSKETQMNITFSSFFYFAAGALGEFIVYFFIAAIIFLIISKFKKGNTDT